MIVIMIMMMIITMIKTIVFLPLATVQVNHIYAQFLF